MRTNPENPNNRLVVPPTTLGEHERQKAERAASVAAAVLPNAEWAVVFEFNVETDPTPCTATFTSEAFATAFAIVFNSTAFRIV